MVMPAAPFENPFQSSASRAGHGTIVVASLSPSTTVLQELSFQYPLKLISPGHTNITTSKSPELVDLVHTVFLLTYGGGLVAGDLINLNVELAAGSRLCMLTQGSTKVYKTSDAINAVSGQNVQVKLAEDAVLCYLPDPVQPFRDSAFEQRQTYLFSGKHHPNLCVCDWVCEGRTARNEQWSFHRYISRNEFWCEDVANGTQLLLRDNVILDEDPTGTFKITDRVHHAGVFGTLIICGYLFNALGSFFLDEFRHLPRIGAKQWEGGATIIDTASREGRRAVRVEQEVRDEVLWTAASSRGLVVVKFSARAVEGGKRWLQHMLHIEGSLERELGERSLMCLK